METPSPMKSVKHWLAAAILLAAVACGTTRQAPRQQPVTAVRQVTLADSIWVFSQTHPDGFTISISTWEMPSEGISVAYSTTQDSHDREGLERVIDHARSHEGYVGGWLDSEDGCYYFDSVRIFPEDSLAQACQFGRENGQIAIYILSSGTEIRLKDYHLNLN